MVVAQKHQGIRVAAHREWVGAAARGAQGWAAAAAVRGLLQCSH